MKQEDSGAKIPWDAGEIWSWTTHIYTYHNHKNRVEDLMHVICIQTKPQNKTNQKKLVMFQVYRAID